MSVSHTHTHTHTHTTFSLKPFELLQCIVNEKPPSLSPERFSPELVNFTSNWYVTPAILQVYECYCIVCCSTLNVYCQSCSASLKRLSIYFSILQWLYDNVCLIETFTPVYSMQRAPKARPSIDLLMVSK